MVDRADKGKRAKPRAKDGNINFAFPFEIIYLYAIPFFSLAKR
jgi:hypothetical protein